MDGEHARLTIGELARRCGLPVRTIRFYSDQGVLPPADRTPAGYRLYDRDAPARLELVRTLRDLGIDLAAVRRVLDREITVAEIAAAHAGALDAQIRTLRLRRAVLRAVATRGSTEQELDLMHKLATVSDEERRAIIAEFLDAAFDGVDADPSLVAMMRSAMPELPDDPTEQQVDAWVELAELVRDEDFRAGVRRMAEGNARDRAAGAAYAADVEVNRRTAAAVEEVAGRALADGIDPASAQAAPVVADLAARFADAFGRPDGAEFRADLAERIATGSDPRAERYWQLLAIINGWPAKPDTVPMWEWFTAALRAHPAPAAD